MHWMRWPKSPTWRFSDFSFGMNPGAWPLARFSPVRRPGQYDVDAPCRSDPSGARHVAAAQPVDYLPREYRCPQDPDAVPGQGLLRGRRRNVRPAGRGSGPDPAGQRCVLVRAALVPLDAACRSIMPFALVLTAIGSAAASWNPTRSPDRTKAADWEALEHV